MAGVEASGKTVDEAVEKALEELGASRDEVRIKVLSEGSGGILGIGGGQARVRVSMLDDADEAEDEDYGDAKIEPGADGEAPEGEEAEAEGEYIEDEAESAAQMLDKMLVMMGIEADVSIRDAETPGDGLGMVEAVLEVEGEDLGLLIGRRGETLQSLQYLLNLMVQKQLGRRIMFTVDVEGYRRRRERQLTGLARRMADQVRRTRRPATLEPMPANERRIIHLALAEDRQVMTESEGDGDTRKVIIRPR
jgi:spoIIIJ-associated protein